MNKTLLATLLAVACISPALAQAQWKPTKPVTIIVPWAAGGATDQVTRLAASEIEAGLGQKIVVVNQPGGAGSIGTKAAMDAPKDGYTWTAGAAKQLGTYPVLGMINSKVDDFHLFLAVTNVSIVSVNSSRRTISSKRVKLGCNNGSPPVSLTPLRPSGLASRMAVSNNSTGKVG